ncbi:hypothetical protein N7457_008902 [Penicillium paradoxum]|uniref:uncharacterized protein n=1 Tax=Penicillium paradoxum TaxID=176176 RepID=UPI0025496036|nr:uncharacterized protein N7457_008902 [Penicillium paradoxum]KAJ5774006.1 hypothetical protein N7457_008902 [Penicillium paradoxum]
MAHGHYRHSRIGNRISAKRRLEAESNDENAASNLLQEVNLLQKPIIPNSGTLPDEICDSTNNAMCLEHGMTESNPPLGKRDETTSPEATVIETVLEIVDSSSHILSQSTATDLPMTISDSAYDTYTLPNSESLAVTATASADIEVSTSPTLAPATQPTTSLLPATSSSSSSATSSSATSARSSATSSLQTSTQSSAISTQSVTSTTQVPTSSKATSATAINSPASTSTPLVAPSSTTTAATTSLSQAHNHWSHSGSSTSSSSNSSSISGSNSPSISASNSASNSSSNSGLNSASGSGSNSGSNSGFSPSSTSSTTDTTIDTTSSSSVFYGSEPTGTVASIGFAPTATETQAPGPDSTSNPDTSKIVGSVVGSIAGLALILVLLLYYLRRRGLFMGNNVRPALLGDAAAGAGAVAVAREITERRESNDPLFTASYFAPAFMKRWRQSSMTTRSGSTIDSVPSERGFQKISGRKIPPVLTHGGDGYGGGLDGDSPTIPGYPPTSPAVGPIGSLSFFAPPTSSAYGMPLDSNYTREVEEHPMPRHANPVHLPISSSVNVGTPITVTPAQPIAQPQSAIPFVPPRPDGLGRSLPSFDGSRSSRFTEGIDL